MFLLTFAALLADPSKSPAPPVVFTPEERAALGNQALEQCSYATPRQLMELEQNQRLEAIECFVDVTGSISSNFVPKEYEPGATILSAEILETFPVFRVRLSPDHPLVLQQFDNPHDYGSQLATRTCNDKWLGGMLDAGMVDDAQHGTIVVFFFEAPGDLEINPIAVAQCFDPA